MSLAIFDLDNTLLGDDSDYLWGRFLIEQGLVDGDGYERENQRFYDAYRAGTLDTQEFLRFMPRSLSEPPAAQLWEWRARFMKDKIEPILLPKALALLERHRAASDKGHDTDLSSSEEATQTSRLVSPKLSHTSLLQTTYWHRSWPSSSRARGLTGDAAKSRAHP